MTSDRLPLCPGSPWLCGQRQLPAYLPRLPSHEVSTSLDIRTGGVGREHLSQLHLLPARPPFACTLRPGGRASNCCRSRLTAWRKRPGESKLVSCKNAHSHVAPVGASQVALVVKNPPDNAGPVRDTGSVPGWGRSPGGGHGNRTPVFLPGESRGQRSLAGYSPQGCTELHATE